MSKQFLNLLLIFLSASLILHTFFADPKTKNPTTDAPLSFTTTKDEFPLGKVVALNIYNYSNKNIVLQNTCPTEPLTVVKVNNGNLKQINAVPKVDCQDTLDPAAKNITIKAKSNTQLRYTLWSNNLFSETGRYKIIGTFKIDNKTERIESNEFEIIEPGFFRTVWINFLYQPIYNFLIYLINVVPNYSLGLAIIILTIIIRLFLYIPNQRALVAQKKMSEIQPKLNKIREKYKNNQELLAAETLKVWKENKVNPVGGCLPLLIQFPILIALFYVIQDGLNPDKMYLLYDGLKNFNFSNIELNFLWMHLTSKDMLVLPLVVGGLQFLQLKLANLGKEKGSITPEMEVTQNMMLYVMPAMIAVFTATLPSGVGVYWGTSTLIGVIQQVIVNKSKNKK